MITGKEKKRLKKWLDEIGPKDSPFHERICNWIIEALDMSSQKIDIEGLKTDYKNIYILDVLKLVAYGTPALPLSFRKKKYCSFQSDDPEFFQLDDDKWERFRLGTQNRLALEGAKKYLHPCA